MTFNSFYLFYQLCDCSVWSTKDHVEKLWTSDKVESDGPAKSRGGSIQGRKVTAISLAPVVKCFIIQIWICPKWYKWNENVFIVSICRYRKCRQCYENLSIIRSKVASRGGTPGKLGQLLREIQILMASMDWK